MIELTGHLRNRRSFVCKHSLTAKKYERKIDSAYGALTQPNSRVFSREGFVRSQNNEEPLAEVLTVEQVQQMLRISRGTVYNLLKRKLLERAYVGEVIRKTLITRESVERLAQSKKPELPVGS